MREIPSQGPDGGSIIGGRVSLCQSGSLQQGDAVARGSITLEGQAEGAVGRRLTGTIPHLLGGGT